MKKANILRFIAALCLLLGSIVNFLNVWIKIPPVWSACQIPLLLTAIILFAVSFKKSKGKKHENEQE